MNVRPAYAGARSTLGNEYGKIEFGGKNCGDHNSKRIRLYSKLDVQLRYKNAEAVGGFISIREGWSHGETHPPKTGQCEVPMSPELTREIASVIDGDRNGHIAVMPRGTRWK
jgi:hypothetical protein